MIVLSFVSIAFVSGFAPSTFQRRGCGVSRCSSTRRFQTNFAHQLSTLSSAKEVILSNSHENLTLAELNEYILQVW